MVTLTLIMLLASAIGGAAIFNHKKRNPWLGALLGFGLGLIGILIAVCLKRKPTEYGHPAEVATFDLAPRD